MAIDFLIFGLIVISFIVNLLALGAFWVTPGLRTMANRFVINLLIINIIGCIILTPPLFITKQQNIIIDKNVNSKNNEKIQYTNYNGQNRLSVILNENNNNNDNNVNKQQENIIEENINIVNGTITSKTLMKCYDGKCEKITMRRNDHDSETIVITEMELDSITTTQTTQTTTAATNDYHHYENDNNNNVAIKRQRWFIDLAAALGALSVLLVVGDTWCAVTDPLRYHTRISALKSWILIASTWSFGILFGVMSALLENLLTTSAATATSLPINSYKDESYVLDLNTNQANHNNDYQYNDANNLIHYHYFDSRVSSEQLYSMIYACIYFIVIILLPFGFVCGMYWRIFSEARKNGLRMRQNGSSPLLQSALNLSNTVQHHHSSINNGLTMKIDRKDSQEKDVLNPLLPPPPPPPPTPATGKVNKTQDDDCNNLTKQQNNIFLTLSKANDEVRRNSSEQQLRLLDSSSSQELNEAQNKSGIRHVQSSPSLLRKTDRKDSFGMMDYTSRHHHHHALQLPPLNASPKSLSYMTSIRHRLSNASSLFKYREESRAARISILVVIMFLVSYLPYGVLILLQERINTSFINSIQVAILMILMGNLSSPFIFAYRNKRVRRGVKRLFGIDKQSREQRLNRNFAFLRCNKSNNNISIRRNTSKASSYSANSSKYLTPYGVYNGTFLLDIEKCHNLNNNNQKTNHIIERIHYPSAISEKRSFLKIVCDSSRKLGCATNSCANSDNEQVDV